MRRCICGPLVAVVVWLLVLPRMAEQRFALLVANLSYNPQDGELKNPKRDIDLIGSALKMIGFPESEIVKKVDVTTEELRNALIQHTLKVKSAGPNSISLFYYSG